LTDEADDKAGNDLTPEQKAEAARQLKKLLLGDEPGDDEEVFYYLNLWIRILTKTGLSEERTKMRPYDARHTMATLLLLERTPSKVVSARLGHASTAITEDVYSHVLESMQDQATDDLERAILQGKKA
jgi:integrase